MRKPLLAAAVFALGACGGTPTPTIEVIGGPIESAVGLTVACRSNSAGLT